MINYINYYKNKLYKNQLPCITKKVSHPYCKNKTLIISTLCCTAFILYINNKKI
jgi:hypothetical protein